MRRLIIVWAAAAALLALSGCTADSRPASSTPSSKAPPSPASGAASGHAVALHCGDYIGTHPPVKGLQVVLGVVALPTSTAGPALQTALAGDSPSSPRLFAKTGLLIKAGTDFQIDVPATAGDRLGIGWGSAATPSRAVVVRHCAAAGLPSRWLAYAGGYWIDHPACIVLQVRTATRRTLVHIGLGTPCPGQRPPPQPSHA